MMDAKAIFAALRGLHGLRGIDDATLNELSGLFSEKRVPPDTPLYREGEPGSGCYVVHRGHLRLHSKAAKGKTLIRLGPGDLVGHVEMLDRGKRTATCTAAGRAVVLELTGAAFEVLIEANTPAAYALVDLLSRMVVGQLRIANQRFADLASAEQASKKPRRPDDPAVQAQLRDIAARTDFVRLSSDELSGA